MNKLKKIWKAWMEYLSKKIDKVTTPPSDEPAKPPATTTPTDTQKPADAAADNADEAANGFSYGAAIDCVLKFTSIGGGGWNYRLSGCAWLASNDLQGEAWIGRKINDGWVCHKYDHFRPNGTSRDWANVRSGYGGNTVPAPGETIALFFMDYNHKRRSNAVFPKWVA